MQSRADRRWSYTGIGAVDPDGKLASAPRSQWARLGDGSIIEALLRFDMGIATPSVMVERDLVHEVGAFDEQQRYGEDYQLWFRLALRSEVSVSPEPLVYVRNGHVDRYTRDRAAEYEARIRLFGTMGEIIPRGRLLSTLSEETRRDRA
jgi:hypothetical protein